MKWRSDCLIVQVRLWGKLQRDLAAVAASRGESLKRTCQFLVEPLLDRAWLGEEQRKVLSVGPPPEDFSGVGRHGLELTFRQYSILSIFADDLGWTKDALLRHLLATAVEIFLSGKEKFPLWKEEYSSHVEAWFESRLAPRLRAKNWLM